ncbi:hypothetical protein G9A89_014154 [Geosiphon pyriformis]|nr:hypothetical protein G9A89_014154 [Geosiphon pyriformis]
MSQLINNDQEEIISSNDFQKSISPRKFHEEILFFPEVKVPFPPKITPQEVLIIDGKKIPSKAPNSFIIYRKAYQKQIRDIGYSLPLAKISSMASKAWKIEPEHVRKAYKELAKSVNYLLTGIRAKSLKKIDWSENENSINFNDKFSSEKNSLENHFEKFWENSSTKDKDLSFSNFNINEQIGSSSKDFSEFTAESDQSNRFFNDDAYEDIPFLNFMDSQTFFNNFQSIPEQISNNNNNNNNNNHPAIIETNPVSSDFQNWIDSSNLLLYDNQMVFSFLASTTTICSNHFSNNFCDLCNSNYV